MVDKSSAPAFSMGHAPNKSIKRQQLKPGPGAYQCPSTLKLSKSKANTNTKSDVRFKSYESEVPGPGSYTSASKNDNGPKALILSRSKQKQKEKVPGPGDYQPNYQVTMKKNGGYQISHSLRAELSIKDKSVPGPGVYNTNNSTLVNQSNANCFPKDKRHDLINKSNVPGPGEYQQDYNKSQKSDPKTVFGKSGRSYSTNNLIPGPGSYQSYDQFKQDVSKSKGFTLSSKIQTKNKNGFIPGPGQYKLDQLDRLKNKNVSFTMAKSSKFKVDNQKEMLRVPGPQQYNFNTSTFGKSGGAFCKEKRKGLGEQTFVPGPGAYNSKPNNTTLPMFSIPKSNTNWIKSTNNPGPGDYNPKVVESQEYSSIKISKDHRRPFYDEKKSVPGPGQYEYNPVQKAKGTGFTIGHEKRSSVKDTSVPGPGNYSIPTTVSNVPKYSH